MKYMQGVIYCPKNRGESTFAIFISTDAREKLSKSFIELAAHIKKINPSIEINIGSADYHVHFNSPQKWEEKAKSTLNNSVSLEFYKFSLNSGNS